MKRIMIANSNCYHGFSLEQAIEGIRKAGFHYIELTATKGWTEHVFPSMTFERLCRIKEQLQRADLMPISMSGHCNLMDSERLRDFCDNIRLAAFFGCSYIVSSVGEAHLKDNAVSSTEMLVENIRSLLPLLKECGLKLVLEVHGEHGSGKSIKAITDALRSAHVLINYDTANAIFYGNVDLLEDFKACVDSIGYVHVKDKTGEPQEWNFPALGEGQIKFPELFKELERAGNNSPLSVEIEFTKDGPSDLAAVDEAMRKSAAYLSAHGFSLDK